MVEGFNSNSLSEKNKEALQSETWKKAREAMEIKHYTTDKSTPDSAYGATRHEVVSTYLETGYKDEQNQHEVEAFGWKYKVLKREKVTTFYDEAGNTLFDVENERLEQEYDWLMNPVEPEPKTSIGKTIANIEKQAFENAVINEKVNQEEAEKCDSFEKTEKTEDTNIDEERCSESREDTEESEAVPTGENAKPAKEKAKEKLEAELKSAKEKGFVEPIINYLLKRCDEDNGLAEDVAQKHKTWGKCYSYIYSKARDQAKGNSVAVRDDVVYEWAEDYYHQDDKAVEEKKAKEAENLKKHRSEIAKKASNKSAPVATKKENDSKKTAEPKKQEELKPKKSGKDMEGQMDLFSLMGM